MPATLSDVGSDLPPVAHQTCSNNEALRGEIWRGNDRGLQHIEHISRNFHYPSRYSAACKVESNICVCFRNFVAGDESCPDQPALAKWSCLVASVGSFCHFFFSSGTFMSGLIARMIDPGVHPNDCDANIFLKPSTR